MISCVNCEFENKKTWKNEKGNRGKSLNKKHPDDDWNDIMDNGI